MPSDGEAFAGVATARDGEATLMGRNCCEKGKNVSRYVETEVTDGVRCVSLGRRSLRRETHAISELRFTRVGVTTNLRTEKAIPGVHDEKNGVVGLKTNPPEALPMPCIEHEGGATEEVRRRTSLDPPPKSWEKRKEEK